MLYLPISLRHRHNSYPSCALNLVSLLMVCDSGSSLIWLKPVSILPFCLVGISTSANYFNVYLSIPTTALCYMSMNVIFPQMKQACSLGRYMKRNFVLCTYRQHSIKLTYILDSFHHPIRCWNTTVWKQGCATAIWYNIKI